MKLGIVYLKTGRVFDPNAFAHVNLIPLAMASERHFLVRIDDESRTAESISAEADFVESIDMITGTRKQQLLDTYCQQGAVSINVAT